MALRVYPERFGDEVGDVLPPPITMTKGVYGKKIDNFVDQPAICIIRVVNYATDYCASRRE